ncbi:MAG: hypothetical protein ACREON_09250 [Gemmatimonadaceae bacterium]
MTAPFAARVLYCSVVANEVRTLFEAARAGANAVILRGHDDLDRQIRSAVADAVEDNTALLAMSELAPLIPRGVQPIVEYCLAHGREHLDVDTVARELRCHRNTLAYRLSSARLPPLSEMIAWSQLLLAAALLDGSGYSARAMARMLSFPSGSAFRATLRRYTHLTPRQLQKAGGYRLLLQRFCSRLEQSLSAGRVAESADSGVEVPVSLADRVEREEPMA